MDSARSLKVGQSPKAGAMVLAVCGLLFAQVNSAAAFERWGRRPERMMHAKVPAKVGALAERLRGKVARLPEAAARGLRGFGQRIMPERLVPVPVPAHSSPPRRSRVSRRIAFGLGPLAVALLVSGHAAAQVSGTYDNHILKPEKLPLGGEIQVFTPPTLQLSKTVAPDGTIIYRSPLRGPGARVMRLTLEWQRAIAEAAEDEQGTVQLIMNPDGALRFNALRVHPPE